MLNDFYNIWHTILDFLTHVSFGSVLTYMGTGAGIFFGIDKWIQSHRKPKASLRFANGKKEVTFSPHYYNETLKYYVVPYPEISQFDRYHDLGELYAKKHEKDNVFLLPFRFKNTGKLQLEDYRIEIEFNAGIQSISIPIEPIPFMGSWEEKIAPRDLKLNLSKKPQIIYSPEDEHPLNQSDHKDFALLFTPHVDVEKIELYWRIIAKDFSDKGKFVIHLKPTVTHYTNIKPVYRDCEVPEGEEKVDDLTPYIKEFEELLKE